MRLQCPKLLWVHSNAGELLSPADQQVRAAFDQSQEVCLLARTLFPGGIAVAGQSLAESLQQSTTLLSRRRPLYQAAFRFRRAFCRVDILNPVRGGKWDIIGVKASASVKDANLNDLAFQRYCCQGAGIPVAACQVLHMDRSYTRHGELDPEGLFASEDVTDEVKAKSVGLADRAEEMLRIIDSKDCPKPGIGPHCDSGRSCPLRDGCWEAVKGIANNIFTLHQIGIKAWPLFQDCVVSDDQLPRGFRLSKSQRIQLEVERTGVLHADPFAIQEFVDDLEDPLHFIDIGTFQTAIPMIEGIRPNQLVPCSFSHLYVESVRAEPEQAFWLWAGAGDSRRDLLRYLSSLVGASGSVVVFDAAFVMGRISECAEAHPDLWTQVDKLMERISDLQGLLKSFAVYHPSQHGDTSSAR